MQETKKYMEIKILGRMDHTMDNTFESANRVYGKDGLCPTLPTAQGGGYCSEGYGHRGYARKRRDERTAA